MMRMSSQLTFLILFLAGFIVGIFPSAAFGEVKTIAHAVRQPFGRNQSPDDARIVAAARARHEALKMAAPYVESLSAVRNSRGAKDKILALASGLLKAEVISQKDYRTGDASGVEVAVRINVDASILEDGAKALLGERTHLEQLDQAWKKEEELLHEAARLDAKDKRPGGDGKSDALLKNSFREISKGLSAVEMVR